MTLNKYRIALYSPGIVGLGHMRRSLLISQALASRGATILFLAESRHAGAFPMPKGMDCMALPALSKGPDGIRGRYWDLPLREILHIRQGAIRAALEGFRPDVLIVDKLPHGTCRELEPALDSLHARGHTRFVLGLRDVLDDAEAVGKEWEATATEQLIRDCYDAVWVYGDPVVYDLVREYRLPDDLARKVHYMGYLDQCQRLACAESEAENAVASYRLPPGRMILCLVGGGQDGSQLAEAFSLAELPAGTIGVIVTGPYMPAEIRQRLEQRATVNPRLKVLGFVSEPTVLVARADRVVTMGGYNSVCEVLSFQKPALVVPRVKPRSEQWIRASRLRELGLLEVVHPDNVSPEALGKWITGDWTPRRPARETVKLDGLSRLNELIEQLLTIPTECRRRPRAAGAPNRPLANSPHGNEVGLFGDSDNATTSGLYAY